MIGREVDALRFRKHKNRRGVEVNLTPLLDIVFNLLIFFLITSSAAQTSGIEVDLPSASRSDASKETQTIVVALSAKGEIVRDGIVQSPQELAQRLQEAFGKTPKATVVIQADIRASHGDVVRAMDVARKAGFLDLAIATQGGG